MESEPDHAALARLAAAWDAYRLARLALLAHLHRPDSRRDPVGEWGELLVKHLLDGQFPLKADGSVNPVQKGHDLILVGNIKVQVKSLSNPSGVWINEHHLRFADGVALYAIVFFHDHVPDLVLVFPQEPLSTICQRLGKRHKKTESELRLTRRDVQRILANTAAFATLGVRIWRLNPQTHTWAADPAPPEHAEADAPGGAPPPATAPDAPLP